MIKIKQGNILNCTEDIIVHQVNVQGVMGGGLARQLADRYPRLEGKYNDFCKDYNYDYKWLQYEVFAYTDGNKVIANMFSQKPDFVTDYKTMNRLLTKIRKWAESNNKTIAIPYGIGCGIATGEWEKVYKIIEKTFKNYDVTLYKLEE